MASPSRPGARPGAVYLLWDGSCLDARAAAPGLNLSGPRWSRLALCWPWPPSGGCSASRSGLTPCGSAALAVAGRARAPRSLRCPFCEGSAIPAAPWRAQPTVGWAGSSLKVWGLKPSSPWQPPPGWAGLGRPPWGDPAVRRPRRSPCQRGGCRAVGRSPLPAPGRVTCLPKRGHRGQRGRWGAGSADGARWAGGSGVKVAAFVLRSKVLVSDGESRRVTQRLPWGCVKLLVGWRLGNRARTSS